jgi:hypothetical protein
MLAGIIWGADLVAGLACVATVPRTRPLSRLTIRFAFVMKGGDRPEEMADDATPMIPISPTLANIARRFNIDLSALAEDALNDRILRDAVSALTARMRTALLTAQQTARSSAQRHIGTEHVFLGILLDQNSIPSQILADIGVREQVVQHIEKMLASESYNRPAEPEGGARSVPP